MADAIAAAELGPRGVRVVCLAEVGNVAALMASDLASPSPPLENLHHPEAEGRGSSQRLEAARPAGEPSAAARSIAGN